MAAYLLYFSYIHFATTGYVIIYLFVARKNNLHSLPLVALKKQDIQLT